MIKSSVLPIGIARPLKVQFPYEWEKKFLSYLGIILKTPSTNIFEANYSKLLVSIK